MVDILLCPDFTPVTIHRRGSVPCDADHILKPKPLEEHSCAEELKGDWSHSIWLSIVLTPDRREESVHGLLGTRGAFGQ